MEKQEKWSFIWLDHDNCFSVDPVIVAGITITASEDTKSVVNLRNGTSVTSPIICSFRVPFDETRPFNFLKPVFFDSGLYVDIDANTTGVMITYQILKKIKIKE
jgi:hypothetical protein